MLAARLYPYDPMTDMVGSSALLHLSDEDLETILARLGSAQGAGMTIRALATAEDGAPVEMRMRWRTELGAFTCAVDGRLAGLLVHDELAGALGKPLPETHRTCRVCLSSELDVWRHGIVDVMSGRVQVYSLRDDLAVLGAHAFLTDAGSSPSLVGRYISLTTDHSSDGALRVPYTPLCTIQGEMGLWRNDRMTMGHQEAFDKLSELNNSVTQFQSTVRVNGPKLG